MATEYHGFDEYDQNAENWSYNEEFRAIDNLLYKRGTKNARPNTAPDKALYLATDAQELYQYDEDQSQWSVVLDSDGGGSSSGDAATVTTTTSSMTASDNEVVLADASGGAITVTLPSPALDVKASVKKIDGSNNAVTVATPNSENIDGQNELNLTRRWGSRDLICDGSNYFII